MEIKSTLQEWTNHNFIKITSRGNEAISAALTLVSKEKKVLIPAEGGWLGYRSLPKKQGFLTKEVSCHNAKIDLEDLQEKLASGQFGAFLYENPGGYFAEEPVREIHALCRKFNCLVILDVTACLGTPLCDGRFADILVGSFGEWKVVDAGVGGFVSCADKNMFEKISLIEFQDTEKIKIIMQKMKEVPARLAFLQQKKKEIIQKLPLPVLFPEDFGLVVIVPFVNNEEKELITQFCQSQKLEWTECPRYIRVNSPAISIELKRLQHA